ncbi:unnamed protein product, partial [marine sediment metagenome]
GLGLPSAHHIVEKWHDGRMWAESGLERGAIFHIILPI